MNYPYTLYRQCAAEAQWKKSLGPTAPLGGAVSNAMDNRVENGSMALMKNVCDSNSIEELSFR
jgi:hypothetical protein